MHSAAPARSGQEHGKTIQPRQAPSAQSDAGLDTGGAVDAASSGGAPLSQEVRSYFEPRFGHDFGQVRIHAGSEAASAARGVQARAYTFGSDIVFGAGEYAPATGDGKRLLAHELAHVIQQGAGAARSIARQDTPYVSPYNEELARELFGRLNAQRSAEEAMSASGFRTRVGAVAAVFDREGKRIATIERMNARGVAHAEQLVEAEIRAMIASGAQVNYTVLMIDQDPCPGTCSPLLKEWKDFTAAGSLRTVTPMRMSKVNPDLPVAAKTAYKDALLQSEVPFEPRTPPPDHMASLMTRGEHTRVRLALAQNQGPTPPGVKPTPNVAPGLEAAAATTLAAREEASAAKAMLEGLGEGVATQLVRVEGKQAWKAAAEAFSAMAMRATGRRLANAAIPVVGAAFSVPDVITGVKDIGHGDIVMGVGTVGVALVDIAAQGLHFTDELTGGGGTVLAWTIQGWTAAMQMGWESARVAARSAELSRYIREHNNQLPSHAKLVEYGLDDEDIMLLESDVRRATTPVPLTTAELADRVRALIAQIEAKGGTDSRQAPQEIVVERDKLGRLLAALERQAAAENDHAAAERDAANAQARQARLDQALRAQARERPASPVTAAQTAMQAPATVPLLPMPGFATHGAQAADLGPFLSQPATPSFSGITFESAELRSTYFGRVRATLLNNAARLESEHFPSDKVAVFRKDVGVYVAALDQAIAAYTSKGSAEWQGVQEMKRLRDAADNTDRSKFLR